MNYMIYNEATKQVAIEFSKWLIASKMYEMDMSYEELYKCWTYELDHQAEQDKDEIWDKIDTQPIMIDPRTW